ncbi:hypothetical protein EDC01DRAFT_630637 [Geopyxis carbonaria]|nr:hypothetical protein EDC01DRAFT_630637 [Geopyxis carbonaria]
MSLCALETSSVARQPTTNTSRLEVQKSFRMDDRTNLDSGQRRTISIGRQTRPQRKIHRARRVPDVRNQVVQPDSSSNSSISPYERLSMRREGGLFGPGQLTFPSAPLAEQTGRDLGYRATSGSNQWRANIQQWIDNVEVARDETEALSTFEEDLDQQAPTSEAHIICRTDALREDNAPRFFVIECPIMLLRRLADLRWAFERGAISANLADTRERWANTVAQLGSLHVAIQQAIDLMHQEAYLRIGLELDRPTTNERGLSRSVKKGAGDMRGWY